VLHEQLRNAWHARKHFVPISPVLNLTPEGLVLGAGTVMVPANGPRRLRSMRGQETRVLALLSAAFGKAVGPSVLGNIERAAKAWSEGDDCLAYIHLAHARLPTLQDPYDAARRLFIVDGFMKAGTSPRAVFEAFHFGAAYIDAVEKLFNPDEPRVPAGSGRTSGEWTDGEETGGDEAAGDKPNGDGARGSSLLGRTAPPAASFLGTLDAAQAAELGTYALRVLGVAGAAAATFGLLFIPSPNNIRVEGEVSEIPGLKYSWNRDETELHLTYDSPDGARQTFTAQLQEDVFRDQRGQVVGRVLPGGNITIDPAAVFPEAVNDNNPKLCPDMGPDKPGERGRDYADYVKRVVNPPPDIPTPRYFGFQLPNPYDFGKLVYYDDCEHATGTMVEAKGPGYADLLENPWTAASVIDEWVRESGRQLDASHGRPIRWYFAEPEAAAFAASLFWAARQGREKIEIAVLPWLKVVR
jgi:hypothetical protein